MVDLQRLFAFIELVAELREAIIVSRMLARLPEILPVLGLDHPLVKLLVLEVVLILVWGVLSVFVVVE